MQGARALVDVLTGSGVEHVFGLPGDTGMAFYDALRDARGAIEHVMTRDERSASFMADVYARVSGRIGVCEGPSGGGATYILPGVAEAQGSAIPLLCLTSDTPVDQQGRGVLTELDQESLFRPVTKWNTRVSSAATMAEAARRAIRMATAGRPGATHLSLPTDALEGESPDASVYGVPEFEPHRRCGQFRTRRSWSGRRQSSPRRHSPSSWPEEGVLTSGAWNELTQLGERLNIPVATSINGKGSIAETSDVAIGVIGGNGARPYANACLADADLVLYIGSRTDSTTTCHWTLPPISNAPRVIQVDVEPFEVGNNYPLVVGLIGDAKLTLAALLEAILVLIPSRPAISHALPGCWRSGGDIGVASSTKPRNVPGR